MVRAAAVLRPKRSRRRGKTRRSVDIMDISITRLRRPLGSGQWGPGGALRSVEGALRGDGCCQEAVLYFGTCMSFIIPKLDGFGGSAFRGAHFADGGRDAGAKAGAGFNISEEVSRPNPLLSTKNR